VVEATASSDLVSATASSDLVSATAAEDLRFEEAARIRDELKELRADLDAIRA